MMLMGTDHLISRKARLSSCAKCHCKVLVGIDEGMAVEVDMIPITTAGEVLAVLDKRPTYGFTVIGRVYYRSAGRMKTDARWKTPTILAGHKCGVPLVSAVDIDKVPLMNKFVESKSGKDEGEPEYEQAMFTIMDILRGKIEAVGDDYGKAPF